MATEHNGKSLAAKTWELDRPEEGIPGHLYYCGLCDEALVLTAQEILHRRVILVFDNTCPGCGFELENNLKRDPFKVLDITALYTNTKCSVPDSVVTPADPFTPSLVRCSRLMRNLRPSLTTGVEYFDRVLVLRKGQLVSLHGEPSNSFSLLLCVRATLPEPDGLDSDCIFIDSGNMLDSYAIDHYAEILDLDQRKMHERIHLSRAFTHHQMDSLITRLRNGIDLYDATLTVVSDMTLLYCDPDVKDRKESLNLFTKGVRLLRDVAEQTETIILTTILQSRNRRMENMLIRAAHASARIQGSKVSLEGGFNGAESEPEAWASGLRPVDDGNPGSPNTRLSRRISARRE